MGLSPQSSRKVFDIVRGWPRGGAVEKELLPATSVTLESGDLVSLGSTGTVDLAADGTSAIFCVVEGNNASDSYSGNYLNKVIGITGPYEVKSTKFAPNAYAPGAKVTVAAGKWTLAGGTDPVNGIVTAYDATAGVLTVLAQ